MKMKRVSSGNLEPMATDCNYQDRGDEIGFLNCCFDQMLLDLRRLTEENEKKQQLLREAQIRSLEQQMNPHFLYNTLDLVYWKAKINGEKEICTITESLAKLLQSSLSCHKDVNSLKQELELCPVLYENSENAILREIDLSGKVRSDIVKCTGSISLYSTAVRKCS